MRKMSTIGRNVRVQTFAKVVDSFVDRYLWQLASHARSVAFIMSTNMLDMT